MCYELAIFVWSDRYAVGFPWYVFNWQGSEQISDLIKSLWRKYVRNILKKQYIRHFVYIIFQNLNRLFELSNILQLLVYISIFFF